jgi:hypothetical protein
MINASLAVLIMTAAIGSQHALQQLLHSNNRLDIAAAAMSKRLLLWLL